MFKIGLKGIKINAPIGYYDWERKEGRNFIVDINFILKKPIDFNDDLAKTINYENAYQFVNEEAKKEVKLIETFIENIYNGILKETEISNISEIHIKVEKVNPFNDGKVESAIIERTYII
jgi:dihydroneopterin aldolase